MAFILRTGAANLPLPGHTIVVFDAGTSVLTTGLKKPGPAQEALHNPFVVPDGQYGFEPPDDRYVDIYWQEEGVYIVRNVRVRDIIFDLGTAARLDAGSDPGEVVQLDEEGKLPAVDGSQLTGIDVPATGLEYSITADLSVGNIQATDVLPLGLSFSQFVERLVQTTFEPTFVAPSFSLSANVGANQEAGTAYVDNMILTYNFNRGQIRGDGDPWNPNAIQGPRAGEATEYVIEGVSTGTANSRSISATIADGPNVFEGAVTYGDGPQPLDSNDEDYDAPLPGATVERTRTITGSRRAFWGINSAGNTSALIRALQNNLLNPANGTTFTIYIPAGATSVVFSYPAPLRAVTEVKYVEAFGADVKEVFALETVAVEGANGYAAIDHKTYRFEPAEPFEAAATYEVTI